MASHWLRAGDERCPAARSAELGVESEAAQTTFFVSFSARRREAAPQQSIDVQAIPVRNPAHPPAGHAREPPGDATLPQFAILFLEQANQRPVDLAEPEQTEIAGANACLLERIRGKMPSGQPARRQRYFISPWLSCVQVESCKSPALPTTGDRGTYLRPDTSWPFCRYGRRLPAR